MNINVSTKNYQLSDNLRDVLDKKLSKLDKYFPQNEKADVMVDRGKKGYKLDVFINAKGTKFRTEVVANDPYLASDIAVGKLERQMSKFKSKLKARHKNEPHHGFDLLDDYDEAHVENLEIVKEKKYELNSMDVQEAILQMEMLQHDFFIFEEIDTGDIAVIYKRKDDGYGIIRPRR